MSAIAVLELPAGVDESRAPLRSRCVEASAAPQGGVEALAAPHGADGVAAAAGSAAGLEVWTA